VDFDVDQGVPVGEADAHGLSGDLGDTAARDPPLYAQRAGGDRLIGAGEAHAVQATAQGRWDGRGQGPDQDAVGDDACSRSPSRQSVTRRPARACPTLT